MNHPKNHCCEQVPDPPEEVAAGQVDHDISPGHRQGDLGSMERKCLDEEAPTRVKRATKMMNITAGGWFSVQRSTAWI